MSDTECPYCEGDIEINHDDGYGFEKDMTHQQECPHCDKVFTFITSTLYCYDTAQAECLNGGEHQWENTRTFPREYTRKFCRMCDEHRPFTPEEKEEFVKSLTPQLRSKV